MGPGEWEMMPSQWTAISSRQGVRDVPSAEVLGLLALLLVFLWCSAWEMQLWSTGQTVMYIGDINQSTTSRWELLNSDCWVFANWT